MTQIKQLLHLHSQGKKIKEIARFLDLSKITVKLYLCKMATSRVNPDIPLKLDNPVLEVRSHFENLVCLTTGLSILKTE